jgi:hypothetical protein
MWRRPSGRGSTINRPGLLEDVREKKRAKMLTRCLCYAPSMLLRTWAFVRRAVHASRQRSLRIWPRSPCPSPRQDHLCHLPRPNLSFPSSKRSHAGLNVTSSPSASTASAGFLRVSDLSPSEVKPCSYSSHTLMSSRLRNCNNAVSAPSLCSSVYLPSQK